MQGVYEIVNLRDGKASTYIGSSVNIEGRWKEHRKCLRAGRHGNPHLQWAWDKYGEGAFEFSLLEEVSEDMLLVMEQGYLDDYFDRGHCYNVETTAGPVGPRSEETKRRIGETSKGRVPSEETRRKLSEALRGRIFSEEHRRKVSEAGKGRVCSAETRRKIGEANRGRMFPEEAKCKFGKPYPAFVHLGTGAVIPAGMNLEAMCRRQGLSPGRMNEVKNGNRERHKGWTLLETIEGANDGS